VTAEQIGASIALAVIGLLLIVVSATARDDRMTPFGERMSKIGIFVGGAFMLPIVIILLVSIVVGLAPR